MITPGKSTKAERRNALRFPSCYPSLCPQWTPPTPRRHDRPRKSPGVTTPRTHGGKKSAGKIRGRRRTRERRGREPRTHNASAIRSRQDACGPFPRLGPSSAGSEIHAGHRRGSRSPAADAGRAESWHSSRPAAGPGGLPPAPAPRRPPAPVAEIPPEKNFPRVRRRRP